MIDKNDKFVPVNVIPPEILRPFLPDFIPALGDIDSCIKISRPDG